MEQELDKIEKDVEASEKEEFQESKNSQGGIMAESIGKVEEIIKDSVEKVLLSREGMHSDKKKPSDEELKESSDEESSDEATEDQAERSKPILMVSVENIYHEPFKLTPEVKVTNVLLIAYIMHLPNLYYQVGGTHFFKWEKET